MALNKLVLRLAARLNLIVDKESYVNTAYAKTMWLSLGQPTGQMSLHAWHLHEDDWGRYARYRGPRRFLEGPFSEDYEQMGMRVEEWLRGGKLPPPQFLEFPTKPRS